jgi:hypothetical protein
MEIPVVIDSGSSSREMCRRLRTGLTGEEGDVMPESVAWHLFLELRRRGEPDAGRLFVGALRTLHSRRTIAAVNLGKEEIDADEHRLAEDPFLADLWKAYKKCIRSQRTGPASQLLRDIEEQICK